MGKKKWTQEILNLILLSYLITPLDINDYSAINSNKKRTKLA